MKPSETQRDRINRMRQAVGLPPIFARVKKFKSEMEPFVEQAQKAHANSAVASRLAKRNQGSARRFEKWAEEQKEKRSGREDRHFLGDQHA